MKNLIPALICLFFLAIPYQAAVIYADTSITIITDANSDNPLLAGDFVPVKVVAGDAGQGVFVCDDVQWLNRTGEPQIPWKVMTVLLPPDVVLETVDVQLKDARYEEVEGLWDVTPAPSLATAPHVEGQQKVFWPKDKTIVDGRDVNIYQKDAIWPDMDVRLVGAGRLRKWRLAQVALPLVKYNPVQKILQRLVSGKLEIYFDRSSLVMTSSAVRAEMLDRIGEEAVRRIAVNFEQQRGAYTEAMRIGKAMAEEAGKVSILSGEEANPGYTIITTSEIQSASQELDNFVAHKQSKGFDVQVITDANFGGGTGDTAAENIRTWLQAHYITDNIQYVLLIGNPHPYQSEVPMKMLYPRNNEGDEYKESPSDYYYADLTGNWDLDGDGYYGEWSHDFGTGGVDRNWEVLVGRIPCYPPGAASTPYGEILYDSGPTNKVWSDGDHTTYVGFMSGYTEPGREQRWSAHPFTIPEGSWNINQIDLDYFTEGDFDLVKYIIWERTGQEKPESGDELIQGTVPAPLAYDDPRVYGADDYLHSLDVNFPLEGGDYYLTVYAERSDGQSGSYLAWLGNTEDGIPLLDPNTNPNPGVRAFFWRSEQFPDPGFQVYNLPTNDVSSLPGQEPNQLYTAAFTIYGRDPNDDPCEPPPEPPAIDTNDLDLILTKIMAYENAPQSESAWRQRILLPMKSDGAELQLTYFLGEEIKGSIIVPKTGWAYYRIYDEDYLLEPPPEQTPCTKDNVTNAWNGSPFGVVAWGTHGSPTSASFVMDTSYADTLNDDYPAFTFQDSCLTANPETAANLAYVLLKNGAVCTIGSTRVAWEYVLAMSFAGTESASGMAVEYLVRLIGDELDSGHALHELKQTVVPGSAMTWMNYPNFCIYGCPALGVCSYEPNSMTIHPSYGLTCEGDAGGPFDPNYEIYTITNESNQPIDYNVVKTQEWVSLNGGDGPLTGTLEPNEATDITVSINSNAEHLPAGLYSDSVEFINLSTGVGNINRRILFKPQIVYGGATVLPALGIIGVLSVDRTGSVFVASYRRIIKIMPDGSEAWHYVWEPYIYPKGLAVDISGNVFLGGSFSGTVDFDPTGGEDWFSFEADVGFLTRINADGSYGWTLQTQVESEHLSRGPDGSLFLAGSFTGTYDFDPSVGEDLHSSHGSYDIFVSKFGPDGSYSWTRCIGGDEYDELESLAVDAFGDIILTGKFELIVDFDPTAGTDLHTSNGDWDAFITKLHSDGSYGWTLTIGGGARDRGYGVAVDHIGNIFVAGYFSDSDQPTPYSIDFDPTEGIDFHICHGGSDAFLTKLGPDGSYLWTRTIGSINNVQSEIALVVTVDGSGNPTVLGELYCCVPVDFDPTYGTDWHTSHGRTDIFVTRLNADGSYAWAGVIGGSTSYPQDEAKDVAVDHRGNVFVLGTFGENADLDPTEGEDWHNAGSNKSRGFITKIERGAVPVIISDTDHDGDVDLTDLDTFSLNWLNTDCANLNWCDWTDFDRSTKVDFIDFAFLAEHWLAGL